MRTCLFYHYNKKGWFSGRRPNLTWWRASKSQSSSTGCQIEVSLNDAASIGMPHGVLVFDAHYSGPLPVSAKDPCMSEQIWDKVGKQKTLSEGRYFIFLRFDNPKLNIGDIATGKVKTTIDSLYPVLMMGSTSYFTLKNGVLTQLVRGYIFQFGSWISTPANRQHR